MSSQVRSKTICGTPGPVVNVTVCGVTFDSMTFEWDHPANYNGDITNVEYKVYF